MYLLLKLALWRRFDATAGVSAAFSAKSGLVAPSHPFPPSPNHRGPTPTHTPQPLSSFNRGANRGRSPCPDPTLPSTSPNIGTSEASVESPTCPASPPQVFLSGERNERRGDRTPWGPRLRVRRRGRGTGSRALRPSSRPQHCVNRLRRCARVEPPSSASWTARGGALSCPSALAGVDGSSRVTGPRGAEGSGRSRRPAHEAGQGRGDPRQDARLEDRRGHRPHRRAPPSWRPRSAVTRVGACSRAASAPDPQLVLSVDISDFEDHDHLASYSASCPGTASRGPRSTRCRPLGRATSSSRTCSYSLLCCAALATTGSTRASKGMPHKAR